MNTTGIRAKKILQGILYSRRVANGYLLVGFDPLAKLSSARLFSQALLCEKKGVVPCGQCRACNKFEKGVHPDFVFIEPDGATLKIDQIRSLKELLHFGPSAGEHLVVLIDQADTMTTQAANSFLKNLEEPAAGIVFILLAGREESLPLTISSRCQRIVFEEEAIEDLEVDKFIQELDGFERSDVVSRLNFAQAVLRIDEDLKRVMLNLISGYRSRMLSNLGDKGLLNLRLANLRLLFDSYSKINLHVNKRLVVETMALKWGQG